MWHVTTPQDQLLHDPEKTKTKTKSLQVSTRVLQTFHGKAELKDVYFGTNHFEIHAVSS